MKLYNQEELLNEAIVTFQGLCPFAKVSEENKEEFYFNISNEDEIHNSEYEDLSTHFTSDSKKISTAFLKGFDIASKFNSDINIDVKQEEIDEIAEAIKDEYVRLGF